jgi:Protein of unknown function (DUF1579)
MSDTTAADDDFQPFTPDPALRRLDVLVGEWQMTGNLVGSDEENIVGRARFRWLEGGFFLVQDIEIDFAGQYQVKSHELIGYDPETGASGRRRTRTSRPRPCRTRGTCATTPCASASPSHRSTRRSRRRSATTTSPAAGGRTPARTKPSTSPTTSGAHASPDGRRWPAAQVVGESRSDSRRLSSGRSASTPAWPRCTSSGQSSSVGAIPHCRPTRAPTSSWSASTDSATASYTSATALCDEDENRRVERRP